MPPIDLCTLDDVKTHPAFRRLRTVAPDVFDEEFVQLTISSVSARFETRTGRRFAMSTYTEYFSPLENQSALQLRGFPITSITSVVQSLTSTWTDGAFGAEQYGFDSISGLIKLRGFTFTPEFNSVRVVYVGGFDPIPSDLKYACVMQVAHEVELAPKTSLTQQSSQTGGQASYAAMQILPGVATILASYAIAGF